MGWKGRGEKLCSLLNSALKWVRGQSHVRAPLNSSQPHGVKQETSLAGKEMTRSQAAAVFIWNTDKWWHNDVRLVLHRYLTAPSPCVLYLQFSFSGIGHHILTREMPPTCAKREVGRPQKKAVIQPE